MKTYQEMTLAERQAEYAALCRTHQEHAENATFFL